ncbi:MICAL-like protein 1 isoform X2 [Battus philenor]|uniref:MICAL-like protein 1 isoform X2 n=1 Tax=Battus philenor TaxID=42288 RepID=UPI0035CF4E94
MSEVKGTKALELWCKRLIKDCPNVQIDNMTTSWRNGMAFCALVHHFRPDLIDLSKLKPENIYENNQLAFTIAEKHLGIPSLLDPEDMVENDVPDRLSVLTYLSQFYQRLSHTVNTKVSEGEPKAASPTTPKPVTPIRFGKTGLDKCAACGLPVYLAQRLMVAQKLYHRRCFRCSKCSGHLNPKNFQLNETSEFCCDACKNENCVTKVFNNNDQMGMLAFSDNVIETRNDIKNAEQISQRQVPRPQSILDKINMFETNKERDLSLGHKLANINLKDPFYDKSNIDKSINFENIKKEQSLLPEIDNTEITDKYPLDNDLLSLNENYCKKVPENLYKSNIDKFNFLQTQLTESNLEIDSTIEPIKNNDKIKEADAIQSIIKSRKETKEESNITDDNRLAKSNLNMISVASSYALKENNSNDVKKSITVPPRRRKHHTTPEKSIKEIKNEIPNKSKDMEYPDHLNPFSDDDDDKEEIKEEPSRISTNPFGSSDEEDESPIVHSVINSQTKRTPTPIKRHIIALNPSNPFWSDGEEPSSDEEETTQKNSSMYKSSMATSTPNLPLSTPRRKKTKAPPPPRITVNEVQQVERDSYEDVASISSLSSHTSTNHSDQKSFGTLTPKLHKKRPAPTPPDSLSMLSSCGDSMENTPGTRSGHSDAGRRIKGPAPGLPLPERREVKMQMSPEELQVQLDMLETQQLGLERQGVLIEQMIRDKCDEPTIAPQEEIEDLVIQLCELVNEKNDLFRKQTELMYIRRQQRLEQEQADIEHEIRIIQSRPAVNRIDADKAREEELVTRLVEIVRMRDELVQQIEAERRRERQEDLAIAASIANKRAQRNSDSNASSIKSAETVLSPKKNKVKDKVKKQLKKAKHTLIHKKKDEEKAEKDKKSR